MMKNEQRMKKPKPTNYQLASPTNMTNTTDQASPALQLQPPPSPPPPQTPQTLFYYYYQTDYSTLTIITIIIVAVKIVAVAAAVTGASPFHYVNSDTAFLSKR